MVMNDGYPKVVVHRPNRQRALMAALAVVLLLLTGGAAFFGFQAAASGSDAQVAADAAQVAAEQVVTLNRVNACRAQYAADVNDAAANINVLFLIALQAATSGQGTAATLLAEVPSALAARTAAQDAYRAAIDRSVKDPTAFLAECRAQNR